jgi:hypothetical protein
MSGILQILAVALLAAGCVSNPEYNKVILLIDSEWKTENEKARLSLGSRFVEAPHSPAFLAARGAAHIR